MKPVVCEPRGSGGDFDRVMADYYAGIQQQRGGVFLAVCRGKVSLQPFHHQRKKTASGMMTRQSLLRGPACPASSHLC